MSIGCYGMPTPFHPVPPSLITNNSFANLLQSFVGHSQLVDYCNPEIAGLGIMENSGLLWQGEIRLQVVGRMLEQSVVVHKAPIHGLASEPRLRVH